MVDQTAGDPRTHRDNELPRAIGRPATRALHRQGVFRLDQVAGWSEQDLLALHGVGPKAIRLLREALAEQGMSLSDPGEKS